MKTTTIYQVLGTGLGLADVVLGQACKTITAASAVPSNGAELALQSYSYCGGTLNATAYIANLCYNKLVNLYFTNAENKSTPLSDVGFGYQGEVPGVSDWEIWTVSAAIYQDGITNLLNLTYQAVDIGKTYVEPLDQAVEASGPAPPSPSTPPAPYATPSGFGRDIDAWLSPNRRSQAGQSLTKMFVNINPAINGSVPGTVVAARSGPSYPQHDPDYEYHWVRDSSLTMDVVQGLYAASSDRKTRAKYENVLFQYAKSRATEQNDPGLQTGLGEPKFYLNQTIFTGPWGRPQNDGPATAAITLISFAEEYLKRGGSVQTVREMLYDSTMYPQTAPMQRDLLFVASNWSSPSFDIWEEEESDHFYDRLVQRRALVMGTQFATLMQDHQTASTLQAASQALTPTLNQFWDPNREILLYEYGPVLHGKSSFLDTAVILGIIHGYAGDGVFGYSNDQVMSTAVRLATVFLDVYDITDRYHDGAGRILGIPVGRYPEDVYNGTGTEPNGGNPWYLCTAALSQYMYGVSTELGSARQIVVTPTSQSFFDYFAPAAGLKAGRTYHSHDRAYRQAIDGINGWGDAFMRTVQYYTPADGSLTEEINRNTGVPQGAADLTWSYASVLSAALARAQLRGDRSYARRLADIGFMPNA